MIRTSIYRPILMLMVLVTFLVFGIYTFRLTGISLMPDINIPYVTVQIIYPGAGPKEIENSVLEKLEDKLALIDGLDEITSVANEGYCFIVLKFKMGVDINVAATDVKDKIDANRRFLPADIENPVISKLDLGDRPILSLALLGPGDLSELRRLADEIVKPELAQVQGVASVEILGGLEREILVQLHKNALESRQLSLDHIIGAIRASNLNFPLGNLRTNRTESNIRINSEFSSINDLRVLEIPTATGVIRLQDIATVSDSFKDISQIARFNQQNSVGLNLKKRSDANIIEVAKAAKKILPRLMSKLPPGYEIRIAQDNSTYIQNAVNDVYGNIGLGIFFTALVLLVFLRNARSTLIAAVTMPVSVICTFTFMYASGFTMNMMTLMALGISVGLLVTNSIVVIENIIAHLERSEGPKHAAEKGASEIMVAVMASTLTNVAVFIPIAFMQSMVGQIFKEFGLTMTYATFVSLLISFTLTPMMAAYLLKKRDSSSEPKSTLLSRVSTAYARVLERILTLPGVGLTALILIALLFSTVWIAPRLGSEFIPKSDEGVFEVTIEMPSGTRIETTDQVVRQVEDILKDVPEISSMYTTIGGTGGLFSSVSGPQAGRIVVQLKQKRERKRRPDDIILALRPLMAAIPDADIRMKSTSSAGGKPGAPDLEIQLLGSDLDSLGAADSVLQNLLRRTPGVIEVSSSWANGKPEIVLRPRRSALSDFGVLPGQVAASLRALIYGTEAGVLRAENDETDIFVKLREADRKNVSDILSIQLQTPRGPVPLSSLAEARQENGPNQISRKEGQKMITVSANLLPGFTAGVIQKQILAQLQTTKLPGDSRVYFGGDAEMMADAVVDFSIAMVMAVILTYVLLTAILESFWQPILIMMTIPLGAIGVIWSLFLTGKAISIISLMAMVMLIGVVVNNAILILDEFNQNMRRGHENLRQAMIHAGRDKFQAILMTNIAAIFSMMPLALGLGEGAEMRQPMAIASVGGLLVSTILTIFLIPALTWLPTGLKEKFLR